MTTEYQYLGDYSAVDPAYSRHMMCHDCIVSWTGCWDNFQCPKCGDGELPSNNLSAIFILKKEPHNKKTESQAAQYLQEVEKGLIVDERV